METPARRVWRPFRNTFELGVFNVTLGDVHLDSPAASLWGRQLVSPMPPRLSLQKGPNGGVGPQPQDSWTRTNNLHVPNVAPYQLGDVLNSLQRPKGLEPLAPPWKGGDLPINRWPQRAGCMMRLELTTSGSTDRRAHHCATRTSKGPPSRLFSGARPPGLSGARPPGAQD